VMAPKMLGAFHLHAATRETPLDFFALYSSASAVLGLIGQAAYAAANAVLDAVAQGRCSAGLAGQSVLWGPFSDAGLAARGGLGDRMGRGGLASLTPEQGCAALGRLLARPRAPVAVMSLSIRQWLDVFPQLAGNPFWSDLRQGDAGPQAAGSNAGHFLPSLEAAAPADRLGLVEQHVREQVSQVLRIEPARIERIAPFKSLGVDSLMSLEVRNRLEASFGLRLSPTLLFTYSNVAVLAEHVMHLVAPPSEGDVVEAPVEAARDLDPEAGDDDLLAAFEASARRVKKGFLS
jgi:acyl carrier protein